MQMILQLQKNSFYCTEQINSIIREGDEKIGIDEMSRKYHVRWLECSGILPNMVCGFKRAIDKNKQTYSVAFNNGVCTFHLHHAFANR